MKKTKKSQDIKQDDFQKLYLRVSADFENYKKRTESDKKNWTDQAKIDLLSQIIPLLDNLTLMTHHTPEELKENGWVKGVDIIVGQIETTLSDQNIVKIAPEIGSAFDPNNHEAIAVEPSDLPEESIVRIQKPGYKIGDKIIRAAQVITSSGKK